MIKIEFLIEQMRRHGMKKREINYALEPLKPIPKALKEMVKPFDNTPLATTFDIEKIRRIKNVL